MRTPPRDSNSAAIQTELLEANIGYEGDLKTRPILFFFGVLDETSSSPSSSKNNLHPLPSNGTSRNVGHGSPPGLCNDSETDLDVDNGSNDLNY